VLRAAREFESIFLRALLAPLEKTTQVGSSGSSGTAPSAYGSMVVGAMADSISGAGGIGLTEIVAKALSARAAEPKPPSPK
jgi:Rod binding domain-containing protein